MAKANESSIKSITIFSSNFKKEIVFGINNHAVEIPFSEDFSAPDFALQIEFEIPIKQIRLPDYTWGSININRIIPQFCNQIIQLQNGIYFQTETPTGIWEVSSKNPCILYWKFNPEKAHSITQYEGEKNLKKRFRAHFFSAEKNLKLLFNSDYAIEISPSKVPFSAIACFTDHCDFDTLELLEKQRIFFKEIGIKTTKGFFLNHFSKRTDNASWENDSIELQKWIDDGHELCYHSLSQSLKSVNEGIADFFNFNPPFVANTWIDHGYQYYNLSLYKNNGISDAAFSENLKKKNIKILWNYVDSGTATSGVLNQLNTNDFTLKSFWKGIRNKSFKKKLELFIKNCIYHFYADEQLIANYSQLAGSIKKARKTKSIVDFLNFFRKGLNVFWPLLKVVLLWNFVKNKVYANAKYGTLFFNQSIENEKFVVFQTIEIIDFVTALNNESVDKLIREKGVFIGHTYFAVPMDYHDGKMFMNNGEINPKFEANFKYLGTKIKENLIWNPTLTELVSHWQNIQNSYVGVEDNQLIFYPISPEILHRKIQ